MIFKHWFAEKLRRWADRIDRPRFARGGVIHGLGAHGDDSIPVMLSPGKMITDPDEAEALGLTVEARRMRESGTTYRLGTPGGPLDDAVTYTPETGYRIPAALVERYGEEFLKRLIGDESGERS